MAMAEEIEKALKLARSHFWKNPAEALHWAELGAQSGDARCQALAGRLLLNKPQVTEGELNQAQQWLKAAVAAGEFVSPDCLECADRCLQAVGRTDLETLESAIDEAGMHHLSEEILNAALPSVRWVSQPVKSEDIAEVGSSKLGGEPDLDPTVSWPIHNGRPLEFVAQLNLSQIPRIETNPLPVDGILTFFYDAEEQPWGMKLQEQESWHVICSPSEAALERREVPLRAKTFQTCALDLFTELTIPFARTAAAREFIDDNGNDWNAYWNLYSAYNIRPPRSDGFVHRSFGHPDAIQGDMTRRIEATLRGEDLTQASDSLNQAATEWRLLFQCDSDPQTGMQWGGDGRIYFWIRESDLLECNFTNVFLQLQTG